MSGGAFGIAVPKADFSTTLGALGKSFADQVDGVGKQMLARDLGEKLKAGDYSGAADVALKAGDLSTGLALVKLGEGRGASKELANTLGGLFGGGADATSASAPGGTLGTMGQTYRDAGQKLPSFASAGGGMGSYLDTVRGVESGGSDTAKNPNSTATGRYQFTQDTWNGLARKYPDLGLTPNGRTDAGQQDRAMQAFTKDNSDALSRAGIPITPGNLYVSHFLGEAGGPRFIAGATSNPDAPATQFVSPGAAAANRTIFFNRDGSPKTAGQVYAERTGHFPGGAAPVQASTPTSPTQLASADPDAANKPAPGAQPAAFVIPGQDSQGTAAPSAGVSSMPVSVQLAGAGIPRPVAGAVGRAAPGSPERIGALIRASLIPGLSEQQQGVVKTLLANEMETGKLTSDQREYAMAQAQGFPGTFIQYKDAQRRPLTPTVLSPGQTVLPPGEYSTPSFVAAPKEEAYTLSPGQQRMQGDRVVASVPDRDKSTEAEAKLRGEFTKQLGTFNDVQDGYRRLIAATEQREANPNSISPASDIALVFGYMRMLDPGSVVREGEYATAQNAGGVDDKVRNLYNKAINGEFLSDGQRQDFIDTAGRLYGQARQGAESVASRYSDLAKGQGLDEGRVVKLPDALKGPKLAPSRADPAADSGKRALPEVVKGGRPPEGYTWDSYLAKSKGILKDRPDLRPQLEDMLAKAGIDPRKLGK